VDRTGCVSVCIATDRQNKPIITITNQQLIKPVCCSASHRERDWGWFGWSECQGCEGKQKYWGSFGWSDCQECEGEQLIGNSSEDYGEWKCNCLAVLKETFTLHFLSEQHISRCF
jgi:hypothetical protein